LIEQIVDFTLGFVICGLIGMAFLPLVSARARRLTLAKIESRLPMTFDEVEAERDLLRARFAVEKRTLELKVEEARGDRAAQAAELGRRAVSLTRANDQLQQTESLLAERNAQLAKSLEFGERTKAELETTQETLAARSADLVEKSRDYDKLAAEHQKLGHHARNLEASLAALAEDHRQTAANLESTEAARRELFAHAEHLAEQGTGLATALAEEQKRSADFEARRARLLAKIAAERQRGEELENTNLSLRRIMAQAGPATPAIKQAEGDNANVEGANNAPFLFTPEQELLDLREAITRIGRHVARLGATDE
jgi:chromosome segregation ATPase